jgi:peroxiredoxin
MTEVIEKTKKIDHHLLLKRGFDILLIAAMIYAALMAFGVVRRGGRFVEGGTAPAFKVQSLQEGKEISLAEFRGKPLLINFFSTDCPSCVRELPHLADIKAEAGDRLEVLVISNDSPATLTSYFKQEGIALPVAYDRGPAHRAYGVDTIPYLVVIDKEGNIQGDYIGGIKWSDVEPWL